MPGAEARQLPDRRLDSGGGNLRDDRLDRGFFVVPTSTCCASAGQATRKAKASAATVTYLMGRLPPEGAGSRLNPSSLVVDSARINRTAIGATRAWESFDVSSTCTGGLALAPTRTRELADEACQTIMEDRRHVTTTDDNTALDEHHGQEPPHDRALSWAAQA